MGNEGLRRLRQVVYRYRGTCLGPGAVFLPSGVSLIAVGRVAKTWMGKLRVEESLLR